RRVRPHIDAAADLVKLGRLLVDIDRETGAIQRQRRGEAADAAADHRNSASFAGHHGRVKRRGGSVSTATGRERAMRVLLAIMTMLAGLLSASAAIADSPPPPPHPEPKMFCTEQY